MKDLLTRASVSSTITSPIAAASPFGRIHDGQHKETDLNKSDQGRVGKLNLVEGGHPSSWLHGEERTGLVEREEEEEVREGNIHD